MADNDSVSLSSALSEMARGNLTAAINLNSKMLNTSAIGKVGEMIGDLNSIIVNLK